MTGWAFVPLTYMVTLLCGLWIGDAREKHLLNVCVLAGMLVQGITVSAKTFRWE